METSFSSSISIFSALLDSDVPSAGAPLWVAPVGEEGAGVEAAAGGFAEPPTDFLDRNFEGLPAGLFAAAAPAAAAAAAVTAGAGSFAVADMMMMRLEMCFSFLLFFLFLAATGIETANQH